MLARTPDAALPVALLVVAGHAWLRRPPRAPRLVWIGADGTCFVPERSGARPVPLGAGSQLTRRWARLVNRSAGLDLLLVADQVEPHEWARLSALLRRLPSVP